MTIAVLPFNAGPDTKPALARQFANFTCDIVRTNTGVEVNAINYLVQVEQGPAPRYANVNPSETLNEAQLIEQLFQQAPVDVAMDGLLTQADGGFNLVVRFFEKSNPEPVDELNLEFKTDGLFDALRQVLKRLASKVDKELPAELEKNEHLYGTDNPEAFLAFMEGYDALQYIDKTQGQVATEFQPEVAMDALFESLERDEDWEAPYVTLVQLARLSVQHRIGDAMAIEKVLIKLNEKFPEDGRGLFVLGELYEAIGNYSSAADTFEKAAQLEPDEPAILTRLGIAQMHMQMPVNAERNFRKAIELEDDTKPSMDFLATVLQQTGRAHEVPPLWKKLIDANEQNGTAHAKYAIALMQAGHKEEAVAAFEHALNVLEDKTLIKRYYAPLLAQENDFDRAMDFYEDCLDVAPTDIGVMIEYAQTLKAGGREFEVPKVLKDVLEANPDPNTKAQTLAWLIELEQPKRIEAVQIAQKKMEQEDYEGALKELRPLRNWLADYWKMWVLLAACLNRTKQYEEAEKAAKHLIELFPGCEPAYEEVATALAGQEKLEEAYNAMRFGMTQIPNSLAVVLNLALAAKRIGREDEARGLARQIREAVGPNEQIEPMLAQIEK